MKIMKNNRLQASIVIPNWNGKQFLKTCLISLQNQTWTDFEIIVVDNGSTDGSKEYIKKYFPKIILIELAENVGFSPAVNLGIKQSRGEYIVLINNDTRVDKNCLKYLVKAAKEHSEVGMVAAKMLQFHNPDRIDSAGDYITAVGHASNIGLGEKDGPRYNKPGYVFLVTGGGGLFKRQVFEKVGFLDNEYFAYFEDVDLCLRAQMRGFKAWYEPKAVIYHIHKATSSRNKPFTEYLQYRNMTINIIKNFPKELLLKDWNWLKVVLVNINTIRFLATQGYLIPALKAEAYILANFFRLLRKRRRIQSKIEVPVEYIIDNIRNKKVTLFGVLKSGF